MTNPVIEAENLCFSYTDEPILDQIGFSVFEGDYVGIIGSNGSGKSTLLRLLLGELTPGKGRISLFGEDVRRFRDWPKIGYVAQNGTALAANFPATVMEIVCANLYSEIGLFGFAGKAHRARAMQALARVGMQDYAHRTIGNLSGGQQQRVMLARVLVANPQLLILDEPTTGVDAGSCDTLYALLAQINREQKVTVVMVTHDTARVSSYANRVLCLEQSPLAELSPEQLADELRHKHKHPHTGRE